MQPPSTEPKLISGLTRQARDEVLLLGSEGISKLTTMAQIASNLSGNGWAANYDAICALTDALKELHSRLQASPLPLCHDNDP